MRTITATLDKRFLNKKLGRLEETYFSEVMNALALVLDFE